MQGASICVAILVTILLIIDGAVALYACLIWPRKEETAAGTTVSEPLFVVGIVTFVICFTLPFVLITGFLCCVTSCQPVDPTKNRSSFECFTSCKLRKSAEDNATVESAIPPKAAAELPNRVDLLPRQFVRSHFGTLLEEHSSKKMDCQHVKSTNKESNDSKYVKDDTGMSAATLHQKECHFHRERRTKDLDNGQNKVKMVALEENHQITMIQ